jgi:hypothetical protein
MLYFSGTSDLIYRSKATFNAFRRATQGIKVPVYAGDMLSLMGLTGGGDVSAVPIPMCRPL